MECAESLAAACPGCGAELPAEARFCSQCARPVAEAVAREPRDYTPRHLADRILTTRATLEGERKQVTVLFADLKGSMALAQAIDPEEWHRIMERFFEILSEGVHRFEGTINQYTGDGIMALFGAPLAHEDHAQRACYAALQLREEVRGYAEELKRSRGLGFAVRMGINSGEVVVGKIGNDLRMDYTAQGHTVGVAARMEQLADPGTAYVSEATASLVRGFFELRQLGSFELKGVAEPVGVCALEGLGELRTRLDVSRARGFSRFVGREREVSVLESALSQAREGNGQVIGVVGDAGVGKSRLCLEFVEGARARGVPVYDSHCLAHGRAIPFVPVLELLRGFFGITERDTDQAAQEKITGRLLLADEAFRDVLPVLFDFLGVADQRSQAPVLDPEARQRQLFAFARKLVQTRPDRDEAIILMDDLHWIDPGSDAFLAQFVEAVAPTKTLLLVNFRPEYQADWMGKSYYQQLPVMPLGPEAMGELLDDLLGGGASVEALKARVVSRAGGTPFFVEEMVQSLAESGALAGSRGGYRLERPVEEIEIPPTVQAVLAARIDRLPEREKQVLGTAAVIGRRFTEPVLSAVAELPDADLRASLQALGDAEFLYQEALYPQAEYAFKHPLTHEVALGAQLRERRARTHAAVARALEDLEPERADENAGLLAHHWEEAGEPGVAARCHARAARWAGVHNPREALRHWRKVEELLGNDTSSGEARGLVILACIWQLRAGWRLGLSDEDAKRVFERGRTLAEEAGDMRSQAALASSFAAQSVMKGDLEAVRNYALEAERLAKQSGDLKLLIGLAPDWAIPLSNAVGPEASVRSIDAVLAVAEAHPELVARGPRAAAHAFLVNHRATGLLSMGRCREARATFARALDLARHAGAEESLVWAHQGCAWGAATELDFDRAWHHARESLSIAEKLDSTYAIIVGLLGMAQTARHCHDWDALLELGRRQVAIARESRSGLIAEAGYLENLVFAHLGRGELAEARAVAEEALEVGERGAFLYRVWVNRGMASVLLAQEGVAAAERIRALLDRAEGLAEDRGSRLYLPDIMMTRAQLERLSGDESSARAWLERALRHGQEMEHPYLIQQVERELA